MVVHRGTGSHVVTIKYSILFCSYGTRLTRVFSCSVKGNNCHLKLSTCLEVGLCFFFIYGKFLFEITSVTVKLFFFEMQFYIVINMRLLQTRNNRQNLMDSKERFATQ